MSRRKSDLEAANLTDDIVSGFSEQVALVTGSSRGLGRSIALELSRQGAKVSVNYVKSEQLAENVIATIKASGGSAIAIRADVTVSGEVEHLVQETLERFGRIDILVNCAGIHDDARVINMLQSSWDHVIAVNLSGTFNCVRATLPAMMKQRYGRIINLSSVVGLRSVVGAANYAASKLGVIALTKTVAKEVAKYGITVNAVAPGYVNIGMGKRLKGDFKKEILLQIPAGRFGDPMEVVKTVLFLASNSTSYITGQVIAVDGGFIL